MRLGIEPDDAILAAVKELAQVADDAQGSLEVALAMRSVEVGNTGTLQAIDSVSRFRRLPFP